MNGSAGPVLGKKGGGLCASASERVNLTGWPALDESIAKSNVLRVLNGIVR